MTNILGFPIVAMSLLSAPTIQPSSSCDQTLSIHLPSSVPFDVYVSCVANPDASPDGLDIFLLHGFVHNSRVFSPAAQYLLQHYSSDIRHIYAIDLPGHGLSEWPADLLLGDLSLQHYAQTTEQVLRHLPEPIDILAGHSMGAMVIQVLQQNLQAKGASISEPRSKGGLEIPAVTLMAPTLPEAVEWTLASGLIFDQGIISQLALELLPYVHFLPRAGAVVKGSPEVFLDYFFTASQTGKIVAGAPTGFDLMRINDKEPLLAASQLVGLDPATRFVRPQIRSGIFAPDQIYAFDLISYLNDPFMTTDELKTLYSYLTGLPTERTGDATVTHFFSIASDGRGESVHDCVYSDPATCVDPAIRPLIEILRSR